MITKQMTRQTNFTIRKAVPVDMDNIFKFLKTNFYPYEAINMAMRGTGPESPNEIISLSQLHNGLSVIGVLPLPNDKERIIGVCINTEITPETWRRKEELIEKSQNLHFIKMQKLLLTSYKNLDIWKGGKIKKCFQIDYIAVDPEFRGENLGMKLSDKSFEIAKLLGYKLVYTECTGVYSAKLAEQQNMKCVYTIAYKDYKDKDGQPVFEPPDPHKEFKIFMKELSE